MGDSIYDFRLLLWVILFLTLAALMGDSISNFLLLLWVILFITFGCCYV